MSEMGSKIAKKRKDAVEEESAAKGSVSRLLRNAKGRTVRLTFFDEEADIDLFNTDCRIVDYEGSWMKIEADKKKGRIEKLIPLSSILSLEVKEDN